jgi:hypothetical protein
MLRREVCQMFPPSDPQGRDHVVGGRLWAPAEAIELGAP